MFVSQPLTVTTPCPSETWLVPLIVIVLDANAELMPKRVATRPIAIKPLEDFLRRGVGLPTSSKRNISMLTPCISPRNHCDFYVSK